MSPLNAAICTTTYLERQKCYGPGKKILFKNNYLTLRSKVKVPRRSLRYATHRIMVMHPHTKYHWPISKDKNVMAQTRKYYLKKKKMTLRSKVKVPQRSLRYVTHRLMVMHPHTKYNWPISKDKNVMAWTRKYYLKNNYLTLRSMVKVPQRSLRYVTHRLMVMHPHTK
jgi:acyl-CoA thioesterase FadM